MKEKGLKTALFIVFAIIYSELLAVFLYSFCEVPINIEWVAIVLFEVVLAGLPVGFFLMLRSFFKNGD